jgi:hypothetical protein
MLPATISLRPFHIRILLHGLFWLVFIYLSSSFWIGVISLEALIQRSLLVTGTNAIMGYGNIFFLFPRFFLKKKYGMYALVLVLWLIPFVWLRMWLEPEFLKGTPLDSKLPDQAYRIIIAGSSIVMLALSLGYALAERYFTFLQQQSRLEMQRLQAETRFLRTRINPHFLFNSLNNLYALTLLKHEKAPDVVLRLSSLMRFMLHDSEKETFTLRQEIQYIRDFAELEMLRFESPKDVCLDIRVADEKLIISPFLLIPLVENCFKYCPLDSEENASVKISLLQDSPGSELIFEATNTFRKVTDPNQRPVTGGIGLANLRSRLSVLYPDAHVFKTFQKDGIFHALLTINPGKE